MALVKDIGIILHQTYVMAQAVMECKITDHCSRIEGGLTRLFMGLGVLSILLFLAAAGAGLLLCGLYRLLASKVDPPRAALIVGGAVLLIGLFICWRTLRAVQKPR